ncbi:hypothetical protein F0562_024940 [Nyssa sinensis]|uniref:Uncharacterized protein n=1 Tax=Nyssa sinensis TaxID=561372 RepID=A0A5J5BGD8_9ASTE|nr:hypothetical protein F0562_024940 [Nyssa sinensis]
MGTTRVLSIQSSSELAPQEVAKTCLQRWQRCTSRAEPESPSRARQSLRLKRWQRHASRGGRDVPPELSQNLHPELVRACASRGGKDMPPEVAEMYLQRWQSQASRASIASRDDITSLKKKLDGKVAIVTGGASGIGEATARHFANHGARAVVIADIQDEKGQLVAASIGAHRSTYIRCDVSDENQVKFLVDSTVQTYGRLDIMFSNAGIINDLNQSILELDFSAFDRLFACKRTRYGGVCEARCSCYGGRRRQGEYSVHGKLGGHYGGPNPPGLHHVEARRAWVGSVSECTTRRVRNTRELCVAFGCCHAVGVQYA